MIADAMGWTLDRITDIQPKLAAVTISSEFLAVDPGVCGIIKDGVGYRKTAGHPASHGSVSRRAGVVRFGRDRRVSVHRQDCGRHPRRRGDASIVVNSIEGSRLRTAYHAISPCRRSFPVDRPYSFRCSADL
jgi:hypothetical protein